MKKRAQNKPALPLPCSHSDLESLAMRRTRIQTAASSDASMPVRTRIGLLICAAGAPALASMIFRQF